MTVEGQPESAKVFLLSPAYCGGRRAGLLMRDGAASPLAVALRDGTLPLGDGFAFMSGLYFRGKLTYARAFSADRDRAIRIITPTRGLQPPSMRLTPAIVREFAGVDVSANDPRYRVPLERDVRQLALALPEGAQVVLLGSVASDKYVDLLIAVLGARLHYPPAFIGRGDMSRGGLMLRSAAAGVELEYAVLDSQAVRHGPRPPKLPPLR